VNPAQSSRTVLVCGLLEAVFVLARAGRVSRDETVKSLWAIGVIALGLSVAADAVPQVAGPFAILILVALAARSRGDLGAVLGVGSAAASSSSGGAATQHPTRSGGESPGGPTR